MGNRQKNPKPTLQDYLIQLKIYGRKIGRDAQKASKESKGFMKKAKEALKRNNQDGAKLYLQSAASKRNQCLNMMRMGAKMQFITTNMKTIQSNQKVVQSFNKMAELAQLNNPNFDQMTKNLAQLEKCMDKIMINGKIMEEVMSQNTTTDQTAEKMLKVLKAQLSMQAGNQLNQGVILNRKQIQFQQNLKRL